MTSNVRNAELQRIKRKTFTLLSRPGAWTKTTHGGPRMTVGGPMRGTGGSEKIVARLRKSSASGTKRSTGARWRDYTSSKSGSSASMR